MEEASAGQLHQRQLHQLAPVFTLIRSKLRVSNFQDILAAEIQHLFLKVGKGKTLPIFISLRSTTSLFILHLNTVLGSFMFYSILLSIM